MRILVDKNIPNITVQGLRGIGHDVRDIRGTPDQGMDDDRLWELAQKEQRLLVTTDERFVQHRGQMHHGILVVRLRWPNEARIHRRVMQAVTQFAEGEWPGLIVAKRDGIQSVTRGERRD